MNNEQKVFDEFVATALGNSDEKLPAENMIVIHLQCSLTMHIVSSVKASASCLETELLFRTILTSVSRH